MVVAIFKMIFIMLIDRIIYTIASFKSFEGDIEDYEQETTRVTVVEEGEETSSRVFSTALENESILDIHLNKRKRTDKKLAGDIILIDYDEKEQIIEIKDPSRWKLNKIEEQRN
jgi:hypothetical protein